MRFTQSCASMETICAFRRAGSEDEVGGMGLQLNMEEMPGYLAARFTGAGMPEEAWRQSELIVDHCKRTNNDRLIIDTTGFEVKISTTDRFILGERLGIFARNKIKVAFVSRPEQIDPQKFTLLVARNRGVTVETFTDFHSAEDWLLK